VGVGRTGYALNLARTALADGGVVLFIDAGMELAPDRLGPMASDPNFVVIHPTSIEQTYTLTPAELADMIREETRCGKKTAREAADHAFAELAPSTD